jgi:hypothetical protein
MTNQEMTAKIPCHDPGGTKRTSDRLDRILLSLGNPPKEDWEKGSGKKTRSLQDIEPLHLLDGARTHRCSMLRLF